MTRCFVSIGSNIEREQHITAGLAALKTAFGALLTSSVYESEPVGFSGNNFYNLVVAFDTSLDVKTLYQQLRAIEFTLGRPIDSKKYSSRTLDLDLLLFGNAVVNDGKLQIPRADIENYAFVLEPLAEIAPMLNHPILNKSYAEMWAEMPKMGLRQQRVSFLYDIPYDPELSPGC